MLLFLFEGLIYFGERAVFWIEKRSDGERIADLVERYSEGLVNFVFVMNFLGLLPIISHIFTFDVSHSP